MIGILLLVLVVGALIAVIFGRKAAQSFVGFAVGILLVLVAGFGYFLYRLDQIGGHHPYPGDGSAQTSQAVQQPPVPQAAVQQRQRNWISCSACGGSGYVTCTVCHGTGQNQTVSHENGPNGEPPPADLGCPQCLGKGQVACQVCYGAGGHYE